MKTAHIIRNSLLTGVFIGLLTGCSWLEDWPPGGSEKAAKSAPGKPESRMEQASAGTWRADGKTLAQAGPKGLAVDDAAAERIAQLEAAIEGIRNDLQLMMPALTKIAAAQGDIQKVLGQVEPAAGGMARHTDADDVYNDDGYSEDYDEGYDHLAPTLITRQQAPSAAPPMIPAKFDRGRQQNAPSPVQQAHQPPQTQQSSGPQPGTVAWYEQQERQNRAQQAQQNAGVPPQQPAYQPQAATYQQAGFGGAAAGPSVTNVRFGEHPDKTRLVLDTSSDVAFSYDVDNNDMLLTISLPATGWKGESQVRVSSSPLISAYSVVPDGAGGHQVVMQLRQPARVLWAQALQPGGPQGHRVVFDIAPL